jgi:dihydroorotate dehydrogenase electron transfer subunit
LIQVVARVLHADHERLHVRVPGWPGHRAGQFAMLRLDPGGLHLDPLLPRPMAIFRGSGDELEFRFKVVGRGTRALSELRPGARLGVLGPLGNGFAAVSGAAWLVGGGTGIASLYELAAQARAPVRVLLGGRSEQALLGLDAFQALEVELRLATEDGSLGHRGLVTELLEPKPEDTVYACGPKPMMQVAAERATRVGAPAWVALENQMACGFGVCLGCAIATGGGYRYVCTHGPVFPAAEVIWEKLP